ncbi:MAG: enoyl-CoA hydratase, partial [Caballeronia sp.]|nr:enoyl-CoA hydratase [Caballeronia sp.]
MGDLSPYSHYTSLELRRHDHGVLEIVMNGAGANKSGLATADANMHREL